MICILFLCPEGVVTNEIHGRMALYFDDNLVCLREVYEWDKMLKTGRTFVGADNCRRPSVAGCVEGKKQIDQCIRRSRWTHRTESEMTTNRGKLWWGNSVTPYRKSFFYNDQKFVECCRKKNWKIEYVKLFCHYIISLQCFTHLSPWYRIICD